MTVRIRRSFARRTVFAVFAVILAASVGLIRDAAAAAVDIPSDPAAHGFIGLCGVDDKPMTGGSIHDQPFVWKALSSLPPQAEAQGKQEVATLYVVQPRPETPASDWNGNQMTATDVYSTPNVPTAQATKLDDPLSAMVNDYPPMVNGLYELRMYLGNEQNTGFLDQYPATFIQVNGDRWSVVQGGTVDCSTGQAVSSEVQALGSASAAGTPSASAPFGGSSGTGVPKNSKGEPLPAAKSGTALSGSAGQKSTEAPASSGAASVSVSASATAPSKSVGKSASPVTPIGTANSPGADGQTVISATGAAASSGSGTTWVIVLVVVVVVLAAGGGWLVYRRRVHGST